LTPTKRPATKTRAPKKAATKPISRIAKGVLSKMNKTEQKFVKDMYKFISKCKPLWKGVPTTCIKNEKCAVKMVTKCFNSKDCRDSAAVKIGHCISAAGKKMVKKSCARATPVKVCEVKAAKTMLKTLKQQSKVVGKFIKVVLTKNVPATCRANKKCRIKADNNI